MSELKSQNVKRQTQTCPQVASVKTALTETKVLMQKCQALFMALLWQFDSGRKEKKTKMHWMISC